jgi:hypothetical protein
MRELLFLLLIALILFVPLCGPGSTNVHAHEVPAETSVSFIGAVSQEIPVDTMALRAEAVRVFLDGVLFYEYIKEEITFVNYVRDRHQAQVHVTMYTARTGSRGDEYTLEFIGLREFEGVNDTLTYISYYQDTEETVRAGVVHTMKLGLMRYVSHTPLAEHLSIDFRLPAAPEVVVDRWDFWVFFLSFGGYVNWEESYRTYSLNGSFSAERVTEELKLSISAYSNYRETETDVSDRTVTSYKRNHRFDGLIVKSLGEHWSAGAGGEVSSSLYSNTKLSTYVAPAVEFNVYPYSEYHRREFVFLYQLGYAHARYEEETIYEKTSEDLLQGRLSVRYELKRRWGSVDAQLFGSHYFHDFDKHRLEFSLYQTINLFEGFRLHFSVSASLIHDQINLPRRNLTDDEILLRQREVETQYDYYFTIGFSYTFGSKYSNVVNPRFRYF